MEQNHKVLDEIILKRDEVEDRRVKIANTVAAMNTADTFVDSAATVLKALDY